ncbi:MAG TPA: phosphohistidine phosphatase SixA [Vicinamibacterales bacterium]
MAVELYLIRHGVAAERGDAWPDDNKRPLTDDGVKRLRKITKGLVEIGVGFDVMLTSPLVRAKQTAELMASVMKPEPPIALTDALSPGASYASVLDELGKHARRRRIALVGHEPGMGALAARLMGSRHALEFKKGAIARIDVAALPPTGAGGLVWFLSPKLLRKLGK